jgi:uncharacterized protein YecT (DUF1311 family)
MDPIIKDVDGNLRRLGEIFTARHILVHELANQRPYRDEDIADFCSATAAFVEACDWITVKHIEGTIPYTQTQMTIDAVEKLGSSEKEVEELLTELKAIQGVNLQLLEDSQAAWEEFAKRDASFFASYAEGGSMHPMLMAEWLEVLTDERAGGLEEFIESRKAL